MNEFRLSTGVPGLDQLLGGGLLPGTLTVVVGATGIGKTQLGLQFAAAGMSPEGRRGIVFDMSCRGDSQNHHDYASRIRGWTLDQAPPDRVPPAAELFDLGKVIGDYLHVFDYHGRRVTRADLGFEAWQAWQSEIARKLNVSIAFFYGNFLRGATRAVIDGIEPVDRPSESIQFEMFEYVYHQILRKEPEWIARDLLREHYRDYQDDVAAARYDPAKIGCLLLVTTHDAMLEHLIERPLEEGDVLSNANTVIYMGKIREGHRLTRALYVPKHRGSACTDEIVPYQIGDEGIYLP